MTMQIYTNGQIELDGKQTGLSVFQGSVSTQVRDANGFYYLPHQRYSLAHGKPASGVAGRAQFETDIRALPVVKLAA